GSSVGSGERDDRRSRDGGSRSGLLCKHCGRSGARSLTDSACADHADMSRSDLALASHEVLPSRSLRETVVTGAGGSAAHASYWMEILVLLSPCCCTSENRTAAFDGCSRTQPREAGPPSCDTCVVPWIAKLPS